MPFTISKKTNLEVLSYDFRLIDHLRNGDVSGDNTIDGAPEAEMDAIRKEDPHTGWEYVDPLPAAIDIEDFGDVVAGKAVCPYCGHDRSLKSQSPDTPPVLHFLKRGVTTGVELYMTEPCWCVTAAVWWSTWKYVPKKFQRVPLLPLLEPSKLSNLAEAEQQAIINQIQENPKRNYAFFGPPGTGKSYLAFTLYRWACTERFRYQPDHGRNLPASVFFISLGQLLDEFHRYNTFQTAPYTDEDGVVRYTKAPEPTISRRKIEAATRAGLRVFIYISEFDKLTNFNEYKQRVTFEIIDALYENEGQLVITSNLSLPAFIDFIGHDSPLLRRIVNHDLDEKDQGIIFNLQPTTSLLAPAFATESRQESKAVNEVPDALDAW